MFRTAILTLLALSIAVGGGAASVWYALDAFQGLGAIEVDGWTAYPKDGTPEADPYTKARIARQAELPLGLGEGVSFSASRDAEGRALRRQCSYSIEGSVPAARFWTLHWTAAGQDGREAGAAGRALQSYAILRQPDNSVVIAASRQPTAGNWLPLLGTGAMTLVLNLYDTPVASASVIAETEMPQIRRMGCDG